MSTLLTSNTHRRDKEIKSNFSLFEREINQLWTYFISAFEYERFYSRPAELKKSLNEHFTKRNKTSRTDSIKLLNEFFIRHKIFYSDNFNLEINNCRDEAYCTYILSNKKLWVMFIILMSKAIDFSSIVQIFSNALRNKVDAVFLFEFFLIFTSSYASEVDSVTLEEDISGVELPEEFVQIYKENKTILDEIFKVERLKGLNIMASIHNQSFNNNTCLDFSFNFQNEEEENETKQIKMNCQQKEKDINRNEEEQLKILIEEDNLFNEMDDIIDSTKMDVIDKSPSSVNKNRNKFDKDNVSPLFFNKSPTLDSYLVPNAFKNEDEPYEEVDEEVNGSHVEDNKEANEPNEDNLDDPKKTLDMDNIEDDEDFLTEGNLHIVDPNYLGRWNFAIFLPQGMLSEIHKNIDYIVTPLKPIFSLLEKIEVQHDLEHLRSSQYHNYVYFPYNDKLIQSINN